MSIQRAYNNLLPLMLCESACFPQVSLKIGIIKLIFTMSFSSFPIPGRASWGRGGSESDISLVCSPESSPGMSHVIWSLVVGLFPHSSSLDVSSPTSLWGHSGMFSEAMVPAVVLSSESREAALLWSPLQVSSLVNSPHSILMTGTGRYDSASSMPCFRLRETYVL